ncbi:MAG TPA: metallophosphoesterase [Candidatus Eremiobacteraceae bacterium]|nr:metallophosphoesterase [Candidatus Eremiobacteraceae bacterium]
MHLDAAFAGEDARFGARRRRQLREAFERALRLTRDRRADAFCVAGDLYEDACAGKDTAEYLRRCFAEIAPTRVFLAPGNHDPFAPTSIYGQMHPLPSNVTLFDERSFRPERLADGITLWGMGQTSALDHARAISGFTCNGPGTHLLLFHGSDQEHMPPGKETIAPFSDVEISRAGAVHAMVGHFHGKLQGTHYAYPGSPEPLNVSQDGEHTASIVTIADGTVNVGFEPLSATRYVVTDLDVAPYADSSSLEDAIKERFASIVTAPGSIFCRLRLVGAAPPSLDPDLQALRAEIREAYPGSDIVPEFAAFDLDAIEHEGNTVRAAFVREARSRIAAASSVAEREELASALKLGLLAFARKRLFQ